MSSLFNVRHAFKKSLFFCGITSSAYVIIILSYIMLCNVKVKHINHVTIGISC